MRGRLSTTALAVAAAMTGVASVHAEDLDTPGLPQLDQLLTEAEPEPRDNRQDEDAERMRVERAWCVLDHLDLASGDGFALLWRACDDLAAAGRYSSPNAAGFGD
jgi:hypothetical protein